MKKVLPLNNAAADELSRQVSDERLRQAGVEVDKLAEDPDLLPSVKAIQASQKKASKLSVSKAHIRKLAKYSLATFKESTCLSHLINGFEPRASTEGLGSTFPRRPFLPGKTTACRGLVAAARPPSQVQVRRRAQAPA